MIAGSLGGQAPLWAIYVAVHKGFFAAEGLDLELNFAQSGAAVTQQLTGGLARRGAERRHHRPDPRHRQGRARWRSSA